MKLKKGGKWLDTDRFVKRARKERKRRFELKVYYRAGQSILETLDDYLDPHHGGSIEIGRIPSKIYDYLPERISRRKIKVVWYAKILLKDLEYSGLIEKVAYRSHTYEKVKYNRRKRKYLKVITVHRYIDVKLK